MPELLNDLLQDLSDGSKFEIKIIDLGFAKEVNQVSCLTQKFGDSFVRPPEFDQTVELKYDSRMDIWYLGMVGLILFANTKNIMQFEKSYWAVSYEYMSDPVENEKNMQYITIETLRFRPKTSLL